MHLKNMRISPKVNATSLEAIRLESVGNLSIISGVSRFVHSNYDRMQLDRCVRVGNRGGFRH